MPRTATDANITTRAARDRLAVRHEPYWRSIDAGAALGYRRGQTAGVWMARLAKPGGGYAKVALGRADDSLAADGAEVFDFRAAVKLAQDWIARQHRVAAGLECAAPRAPYTVREAVADYLADYTARGGKARRYVEGTFDAHVLPALGGRPVASLGTADLSAWHRALAEAPARLRSKASATERRVREVAADDTEGRRARRSTANGVLTLLKAALNHAFRMGRAADDTAWRRVRPFQKVSAARVCYLTDDEARRLASACPPDLRALVTAALLTGARYNELASLRAADFDDANGTVHIAESKGGKARHVALTDEGRDFFRQATVGRTADAVLLPRADGRRWNKSEQFRPMREACAAARIAPAASFHILRHTYASRLAMRGVPIAVIAAQLGHADLRITTRHYAHLAPSYVADTVRAAFGNLDLAPLPGGVTNVVPARLEAPPRRPPPPRSPGRVSGTEDAPFSAGATRTGRGVG